MAKRNKEKTMTVDQVIPFQFPKSSGSGRERIPSKYEDRLIESFEAGEGRAIVYDGSDEKFNEIRRELERGARHLDYGLRGPARYELEDGTNVVAFQCGVKRDYNKRKPEEETVSEN